MKRPSPSTANTAGASSSGRIHSKELSRFSKENQSSPAGNADGISTLRTTTSTIGS